MRLESYLERNAANMPHRTALTDRRRSLDYVSLLAETRSLAAALSRRGVEPGDRVALIAPNRIELVTAAFACFAGGFVFQPINYRLSTAELTAILDDAQPSAAIVDGSAFPTHAEHASRRTDLRALVTLGEGAAGYHFNDGDETMPDPAELEAPANPTTTAALLYTGGTTGTPKGTVLSHRAWVHSSRDGAYALRLGRRDVSYVSVPLFHVSFVHFLSTAYVGVPTILDDRVRPDRIIDAIANRGATHTVLVQAPLVDLVDHLDQNPVELPAMSTLQYGGSPIAPAVIERVCERLGDVLLQNYGSTESGGALTYLSPEDHNPRLAGEAWQRRISSAGVAMPGVELRIRRSDGTLGEVDEPGELEARSPAVMDGYWGNAEATSQVLSEDGWLATGDIGRLDVDGYLYIVDRKKDMIISGGENIYARDVEDALLAHPDVGEAAVVGAPNPRLGEEVVAFVVPRGANALTESDLLGWVKSRLATYKKPARVLLVEELPRTPVGKVHKPTLRERLAATPSPR